MVKAGLLSALILPGAGQLYNEERKKGFLLLGVFLLAVVSFTVGFMAKLSAIKPPNFDPTDQAMTQALIQRFLSENGSFFGAFSWVVGALWLFGVVDAVLGARERGQIAP